MAAVQDGDLRNVTCCNALSHSLSRNGQANVVEHTAKEGLLGQGRTLCSAHSSVSMQACARVSQGRSHNVKPALMYHSLYISHVFAVLQGTISGQFLIQINLYGGWQGAKGLALSGVRVVRTDPDMVEHKHSLLLVVPPPPRNAFSYEQQQHR